jgi:hypothetical protein
VALREAMPAGTFIRRDSRDSICLEMNDTHESPTVRAAERFSAKDLSECPRLVGVAASPERVTQQLGQARPA